MAKDLPYLPTYKNVGVLFDKIEKAKVPDVFNLGFLTNTIDDDGVDFAIADVGHKAFQSGPLHVAA